MNKIRWISVEEKKPLSNGKYWVYPYLTLDGKQMVTMISYKNGEWDETYSKQTIMYWMPIQIPKPPKIPKERGF